MSYFPDLGTETYHASAPYIRAIGWLDESHEFSKGSVSAQFVNALRGLIGESGCSATGKGLKWPISPGFHRCQFCNSATGIYTVVVPDDYVLWVAPTLVLHYIEEHNYKPDEGFIAAVENCPDPNTAEFLQIRSRVIESPG